MTTLLLCLALQDAWAKRIDDALPTVRGHDPARVAAPAEDAEFLRRAMLDLVGAPPTAAEARAFLAAPDRSALIDRLTGSDAFARFWARRLADVLVEDGPVIPLAEDHPAADAVRDRARKAFEDWLADALRRDRPWPEIVSRLVSAGGRPEDDPAVLYKLQFVGRNEPFLDRIAGNLPRHLLGIDFRCALCHDHPFDAWGIPDARSISSFFAGQKPSYDRSAGTLRIDDDPAATARLEVEPRWFLGGKAVVGEDRPAALAALLAKAPQLDRALANRVWGWLFGRALVDPPDQFDVRRRPLSPVLLTTLVEAFRGNGRSIRSLVRVLCATSAYGRSSRADDAATSLRLERQAILPLSPEQFVNALQTATLGAPRRDPREIERLAGLLGGGRWIGCEVRPLPCGTIHALYLRNSEELWTWITEGPVLARVAALPPAERLDELFLSALGRRPSAAERLRFEVFLDRRPLEDALWILLNAAEFLTRS